MHFYCLRNVNLKNSCSYNLTAVISSSEAISWYFITVFWQCTQQNLMWNTERYSTILLRLKLRLHSGWTPYLNQFGYEVRLLCRRSLWWSYTVLYLSAFHRWFCSGMSVSMIWSNKMHFICCNKMVSSPNLVTFNVIRPWMLIWFYKVSS